MARESRMKRVMGDDKQEVKRETGQRRGCDTSGQII